MQMKMTVEWDALPLEVLKVRLEAALSNLTW